MPSNEKTFSQNLDHVVIVVDNLRVGGIQRLALDEAYALADKDFKVHMISLEKERFDDDIYSIDNEFTNEYSGKMTISYSNGGNIRNLFMLRKLMIDARPQFVICHSAKGMPMLYLAKLAIRKLKSIQVFGYIHQLITLSGKLQKIKRLLYFTFADELRASSLQFITEINEYKRKYPLTRLLFRTQIILDRMGIYLKRTDYFHTRKLNLDGSNQPEIIFLSRVVGWKGFETFLKIAQTMPAETSKVVFASSLFNNSSQIAEFRKLQNARVIVDSQIARYRAGESSVHLYPTSYGEKVRYQQNIGMNVLECISQGIPSLISRETITSWPEFTNTPLVQECDWSLPNSINKLTTLFQYSSEIREREKMRLRKIVSIEDHIDRVLESIS